jgi:hypothetical protein
MAELLAILGDLSRFHVLATLVGIGIGLDIPLVEQAMEWFFARYMAEVEQHLVPKAAVQQVQHRVLDAAYIQVDATDITGLAGAHPILLIGRVDEGVFIGRVEIAQLVPARPSPLRHHV